MPSGWVTVGATDFNGSGTGSFGSLDQPGYHYAELGTASVTTGGATGHGNLYDALHKAGLNPPALDATHRELPAHCRIDIQGPNGKTVTAEKGDRGAGQAPYGPDGAGDPAYAVDLWLGGGSAGDLASAIGFSGKGPIKVRLHDATATDTAATSGRATPAALARGTTSNPGEDTWTCVERLASEVNWVIFTDPHPAPDTYGNYVYYMTQPELEAQEPALVLELSDDGTEWAATSADGTTRLVAQDTVTGVQGLVDNSAFQLQTIKTHKGKQRRPAVHRTPQSPTQIRFSMICDVLQYCAGQTVHFKNAGPMDGTWIISDSTQNVMSDLFAQFTLTPPSSPHAAPTTTTTGTGGANTSAGTSWQGDGNYQKYPTKTAARALAAAKFISDLKLPYVYGGFRTIGAKPTGGMDCSGSSNWVLGAAGWDVGTSSPGSGAMMTWGSPGPGKQLTIHCSPSHEFLEFNIDGHHLQFNTSHSGIDPNQGPLLTAWGGNGAADAATPGFVSRHPAGA